MKLIDNTAGANGSPIQDPHPGPGRPFGSIAFASWRGFLTRRELSRIHAIEDLMKSKASARHEGVNAAKYEYASIRNRAVKRANNVGSMEKDDG